MAEFKNELILQDASGVKVSIDLRNALVLSAAPTSSTAARAGMQAYVVSGGTITAEYVCTAVSGGVYTWVKREISGGTVDVDATLTQSGMAADAKAAGDAIGQLSGSIADLTAGDYNSIDFWEQGLLSAQSGAVGTSTVRIRTKTYISNAFPVISAESPYKFGVFAYDSNDKFVGVWDGSAFVKSQTWFESFDLSTVAGYGYKYKLLVGNNYETITPDIYVRIHFTNAIYDKIKSAEDSVTNQIRSELVDILNLKSLKTQSNDFSYNFVAGQKYKITNNTTSYITVRTKDANGTNVNMINDVGAEVDKLSIDTKKYTTFTAGENAVTVSVYFDVMGEVSIENLSLRVPELEETVSELTGSFERFHRQSETEDIRWEYGGIEYKTGKPKDDATKRIRTGYIPVTGYGCTVTFNGSGKYFVCEYTSNNGLGGIHKASDVATWCSDRYTIENDTCKYIRIVASKTGSNGSELDFADENEINEFGKCFTVTQSYFTHRAVGRYVSPAKERFVYNGEIKAYSSTVTLAQLYAMWDGLHNTYPEVVSAPTVIGTVKDNNGNDLEIRHYRITPTQMNSSYRIARYSCDPLKIVYISSVHGGEGAIAIDDFTLFENLVVNHTPSILWDNCVFEVVPAANAWGYNYHSRLNANGININRNFPVNWKYVGAAEDPYNASGEEACDQYETNVLMNFVKSHPDAFLTINRHGTDDWKLNGVAGYAASVYQSDIETIIASGMASDSLLRSEYPEITNAVNPNSRIFSVLHSSNFNGSFDQWYTSIGYHGYLLEYCDKFDASAGVANGSDGTNADIRKINITAIANLLCDSVLNNRDILGNNNRLTDRSMTPA